MPSHFCFLWIFLFFSIMHSKTRLWPSNNKYFLKFLWNALFRKKRSPRNNDEQLSSCFCLSLGVVASIPSQRSRLKKLSGKRDTKSQIMAKSRLKYTNNKSQNFPFLKNFKCKSTFFHRKVHANPDLMIPSLTLVLARWVGELCRKSPQKSF